METIFLDNVVAGDVKFIMQHSPRVCVDLGVLMFIYGARSWGGRVGALAYIPDGWTQVPINWFARQSNLGVRTIQESLERLKKWGMIVERHRDNKYQSRVFLYKKHSKPHVPHKEISPEQHPTRPPLVEDANGVYGLAHVWNHNTYHMDAVKVGPKEYTQFPICPACGRVAHPTEGWDASSEMCSECHIAKAIDDKGGPKDTMLVYKGYEKEFTKDSMKKWLDDTEYMGGGD